MTVTNTDRVRRKIEEAESLAGLTPGSVTLVVVTKKRSIRDISQVLALGEKHFAESYVQEAISKIDHFCEAPVIWHFIGKIQSNKIKKIAQYFDWVDTVTSIEQALGLSHARSKHQQPLNVCIQIQPDGANDRNGVSHDEAIDIAKAIEAMPGLHLRGLMLLPLKIDREALLRSAFLQMAQLKNQMNQQGLAVDILSMGMSADFETAIACGSNMIRIGSKIFTGDNSDESP